MEHHDEKCLQNIVTAVRGAHREHLLCNTERSKACELIVLLMMSLKEFR